MVSAPPVLVALTWIALEYFDGSLFDATAAIFDLGVPRFMRLYAPSLSLQAAGLYFSWVLFQAVLYSILPGKGKGQLTPAGQLLEYNVNGLLAWEATVILAVAACIAGVLDPSMLTDNWEGMIVTMNIYGYCLSIAAYLKAHIAPTHPQDRKFSGSALYDFYMGIELNPRFTRDGSWDWKLFHNGRPGIIGWTLIDLSYAAMQYRKFGYVSASMVVAVLLHTAYVVDFFINEDWYLRTIDICHDHFGYYLAWGSAAWLPTMYTLQVQYLARNPVDIHPVAAVAILITGLSGYALFRSVNDQKNRVRKTNGDCMIWGKPAEYIRADYKTSDGVARQSLLLCSGWWSVARHANYIGDLILSFAMCATCGFTHILPWTYGIFMTAILVHRCHRDEKRCKEKYGKTYEEYCRRVPFRLIPGVY